MTRYLESKVAIVAGPNIDVISEVASGMSREGTTVVVNPTSVEIESYVRPLPF